MKSYPKTQHALHIYLWNRRRYSHKAFLKENLFPDNNWLGPLCGSSAPSFRASPYPPRSLRAAEGRSVCSALQSRQDSVPMVCHEYFTILLRNLRPGIRVESSLSASPRRWVQRPVCSHQLSFFFFFAAAV